MKSWTYDIIVLQSKLSGYNIIGLILVYDIIGIMILVQHNLLMLLSQPSAIKFFMPSPVQTRITDIW